MTARSKAKSPTLRPVLDDSRVVIFDTTLRDGEQSPGCSMNLEEKLRVAKLLEDMGVDVIEAGFPIASNGDFEAVREVAAIVRRSAVAGLARARRRDIDRAWEALRGAVRPRIHTFISTSPLHMKYKLQMEPDAVHDAVVDSVSYARNLCDDVEWSPEDGSRTETGFPVPHRGRCHHGRRSNNQHPGHRRLRGARGICGPYRDADGPSSKHRQGRDLRPLPQ